MMDHVMARLFWDLIKVEADLRDQRAQVQRILDSMPDIVMVLDREMRTRTVNAGFTRFTGLTRSQAHGQFCHDVICERAGPRATPDFLCPFDEVMRTRKRVSLVQIRECVPGREEHFEITMTPILGKDGEVLQVVEALHPITERVRLSREVEESAQRFREFIDSADDLISIKDPEGRYQVVNKATAAFFSMQPEDCEGKTVHELYPRDIADLVAAHDREVMARGQAITYEETLNYEGRENHMNTIRFPLRDYKGDVTGVCTISRDVTREKRLQRELVQADKLAAIGKLAAGVAHEINNPLTGILAFAEDLKEELDEREERELGDDCGVIIRETMRCREIVKNLLDFAKQRRPQFRLADLTEVVTNTLALVQRLLVFRDVEIRTSLAEELPPLPGDPGQLQQVLLNLLVNAAEGMNGRGEVEISTGVRDDGRTCHLTVADRGPGIPVEAIGRIFEPFFSTKRATHGMGLAVSWGIVERHGGRIEAENREDGGTIFRVILPMTQIHP
jgi:PAS domain S-box-containing protein